MSNQSLVTTRPTPGRRTLVLRKPLANERCSWQALFGCGCAAMVIVCLQLNLGVRRRHAPLLVLPFCLSACIRVQAESGCKTATSNVPHDQVRAEEDDACAQVYS